MKNKRKNKFSAASIILIILIIIRIIAQAVGAIYSSDNTSLISYLFFGILYAIALIGIYQKRKYGVIISIIVAAIDLLGALMVGGVAGVGAGIVDAIILFLSLKEYKTI
ncbi:MAG: hypothetical protein Q8N63_04070 [Nanoarchaeota archaeon]|nr:hypothetical protein [Nanoarchaeota archaeon]